MEESQHTTFNQRFGIVPNNNSEKTFPPEARSTLMFILENHIRKNVINNNNDEIDGWAQIYRELLRVSKQPFQEVNDRNITAALVNQLLLKIQWNEVFCLCERIYKKITNQLQYNSYDQELVEIASVEDTKNRFEYDINDLLAEHNLPYNFVNGVFIKPGHLQTQKNINRSAAVLNRAELRKVREHFNKAIEYFTIENKLDYNNSIKESLCALELTAETMSGKKVSKDFNKEIQQFSGIGEDKIPPLLIAVMIKLFAYRGGADGVAHGLTEGYRVSENECELVISTTAALITYLIDFFTSQKENIPF